MAKTDLDVRITVDVDHTGFKDVEDLFYEIINLACGFGYSVSMCSLDGERFFTHDEKDIPRVHNHFSEIYKRVARKSPLVPDCERGEDEWACPTCGECYTGEKSYCYCPNCGQAIDWEKYWKG